MAEGRQLGAQRHGFRGTGVYWSLPVAAALGIAILVGIVQNTQTVQLRYLGWDARTPLVVALLITVFVSAVLTVLVGAAWRRRRRGQLAAGAELTDLRGQAVRTTFSAPSHSAQGAGNAPERDRAMIAPSPRDSAVPGAETN